MRAAIWRTRIAWHGAFAILGTVVQLISPLHCRSEQDTRETRRPESASRLGSDQPIPRQDAVSQLAHQQLVRKARQGGIDLYFVGDSIVRRWGCSDPQYHELLENWKANFYGWNAGNFGWGADQTQHILWRLQNGELDGVHPKVIVVLAGTNNVDALAGSGQSVDEVVGGIKAILDVCREKAPGATIVLTAIFPRNDKMELMPTIDRVNQRIAQLADGKTTRFVNINDRLADRHGVLFEGMMADKLHPTTRAYQIWADALRPVLTEIMGPRAQTDHAPKPTGDPSLEPPREH